MLYQYTVFRMLKCKMFFGTSSLPYSIACTSLWKLSTDSRFACLEPRSNWSQHKLSDALVHGNSSVNQLLLYDVITLGLSTRDTGSDADRGYRFKDHFASTRPQSGSELRALLRDSAWDPVKQCNAHSLHAVRSSRVTTLNAERGSRSSESVFSARV